MPDPAALGFAALLTTATGFVVSLLLLRELIPWLIRRGLTVEDYHKPGKPQIPRPGGPALLVALAVSELLAFLLTGALPALAVLAATLVAGLIGLVDDLHRLGAIVKPGLTLLAGLPLLLIPNVFDIHLALPLFGTVRLSLIYPVLVLLAIPVTTNTFNTIDVLNGVVSGFTVLATLPLLVALVLRGRLDLLPVAAPLLATALALYIYHRYPSRIFPGDSGTMAFGATYGALTITGGIEVAGVVALLPAILNSFYFLASVRRLVEHRELRTRPVQLRADYQLEATVAPDAPVTLVRMIVADGPLNEEGIARHILILGAYSALLATITAFLTWGIRL